MRQQVKFAGLTAFALLSASCLKVPAYQRPSTAVPQNFKEDPPKGWKEAQPSDGLLRGKWWEIFGDPALNALEEQVSISNQNVQQAEAQFREAKAAVRVSRSALFPLVTTSPSITASQASSRLSSRAGPSTVLGTYDFPFSASYTADVWGSIRRSVTASANTAQSLAAALENARLLYQSELAQDYFQLHGMDGDAALLRETVQSYQEFLVLTQNRYAGGIASDSDVALAETQLYNTQAQLTDIEVQRSQLEHAIAILIGKPPAELSVPRAPIQVPPPRIPVGVPSALLERRPDIADAERQAAAANQQIGIAKAAFFPTLTLAASTGFESSSFLNWITFPSRFWTIGPQLAQTLFDAGKRTAQVAEAEAGYDATAANYRQSVLTAFQQVEDNLSALRVLADEATELEQAVKSAERSVTVSTAQYRGGVATYLQVITTQAIALQDQRSAIDLQTRRMTASVLLIEALGGGWDNSTLPTTKEVAQK
ncbi:MAG TPA: efflux transporter outer membrane subunit [Bryobacteraceae bacterium]|jgi:NodT family efflux transporter outer membrane factor (OMF) lipoprotein|nr:efflux transporter outer membrane subunit [Bryobacteraceae bacterium]